MDCCTVEEAWAHYRKETVALGFLHAQYGHSFSVFRRGEDYKGFVVTDYPQEFLNDYEQAGGMDVDASVLCLVEQGTPTEWGDPEVMERLPEEQKVLDEASLDHGILYGYSVPAPMQGDNVAGFGLSATKVGEREFRQDIAPQLDIAVVFSNLFHFHLLQMPRQPRDDYEHDNWNRHLIEKEVEVIRWLVHGYTIQQIAELKMFRSQESVNRYIRNAKKKLKAGNIAQLVGHAMILNLV